MAPRQPPAGQKAQRRNADTASDQGKRSLSIRQWEAVSQRAKRLYAVTSAEGIPVG